MSVVPRDDPERTGGCVKGARCFGPGMPGARYRLSALVSSANIPAVQQALDGIAPGLAVRPKGDHLEVEGALVGTSAQDLNRNLLSAMRRVEKRTRLRAEWTSEDGTRYRYFDYVLKRTTPP
jgi:hypothetical protein